MAKIFFCSFFKMSQKISAALCGMFVGAVLLGPVAHAGTHSVTSAQDILHTMAQRTAKVHSLYTLFEQEKKLAILAQPLRSQGYLCLQKKSQQKESVPNDLTERLVWAYTAPQASGFATIQGKNYQWNGSLQELRAATGPEAMVLKTVSEHIQAWVQVQPDVLQKLYTVQSRKQDGKLFLLLEPKQKQNFFVRLEAELRPHLDGVQSLTFWENTGDSMRIHFADPVYNAPLPASCLNLP